MKHLILVCLGMLALSTSCKTTTVVRVPKSSTAAKPLPPGQAKKVYGTQSAKSFAPGKKNKN